MRERDISHKYCFIDVIIIRKKNNHSLTLLEDETESPESIDEFINIMLSNLVFPPLSMIIILEK